MILFLNYSANTSGRLSVSSLIRPKFFGYQNLYHGVADWKGTPSSRSFENALEKWRKN